MDVTNRFVLDFARSFERRHPAAAMLDFGCGAGALVEAARAAGLDMVGADVFYGGSRDRIRAEQTGLLGSAIFESRDGCLPFPGASFGNGVAYAARAAGDHGCFAPEVSHVALSPWS